VIHVAPNGPPVHPEPIGEFAHRPHAADCSSSSNVSTRAAGRAMLNLVSFFTPVTPAAIAKFAR
jgi:hypothetical protein